MKELRKALEDKYLTFITIAAGAVAFIAFAVWAITFFAKKIKNNSRAKKA